MIKRRQGILELLSRTGGVKIDTLTQKYKVGKETIRRDLKALAEFHDIAIVYGGAHLRSYAPTNLIHEENIIDKRTINLAMKHIIAKKAVDIISPGDIIALNSGSTVECMLNYLHQKTPLSLITLSVNIAAKAVTIPNIDIYIPGGKIRNTSGSISSIDAEEFIKKFTVNKCFFGISAICMKRAITHPNIEEVMMNRALLSVSDKVYVVADHSKFDKQSLYEFIKFDEFTGIITDDKLPNIYARYFQHNGIEII